MGQTPLPPQCGRYKWVVPPEGRARQADYAPQLQPLHHNQRRLRAGARRAPPDERVRETLNL